jgi:hypothetical protein
VDSGDSDVVKPLDLIAHYFRGDNRFFGDRKITGSGRDDRDKAFPMNFAVAPKNDGARDGVKLCAPSGFLYSRKLFLCCSRDQDVAAVLRQLFKDSGDLRGGFALSQNNFRNSDAKSPVMIDLGETEIFERKMAQASNGSIRRQFSRADLLEKSKNGFSVHEYSERLG